MMVMMMMMVNSPLERETEDMFFREVSNHRLQSEFLEFQNFGTFLFAQMFTDVSYPCLPNLSERSLHDPKRIRMHFCWEHGFAGELGRSSFFNTVFCCFRRYAFDWHLFQMFQHFLDWRMITPKQNHFPEVDHSLSDVFPLNNSKCLVILSSGNLWFLIWGLISTGVSKKRCILRVETLRN